MTDSFERQMAQLADAYKQWNIGVDQPGPVLPKGRYTLRNSRSRKFLQYEKQTWGINLGWTDDATAAGVARWFVTRKDGRTGPVPFEENVALANGTGDSWLRYAERDFGINLTWSGQPVFEWTYLGGRPGQAALRGQNIAIYNQRIKLFLVQFDRDIGGDVGWSDSKSWLDRWGDKFVDLVGEYGTAAVEKAVHAYLAR
ncbi:MAG: hypothetical protein ABW022_05625 [Actinoplanes sp.]